MATYYTPTVRNVLRIYRWVSESSAPGNITMDWAVTFTKDQAREWLRKRLHEKINRHVIQTRKMLPEYQHALRRSHYLIQAKANRINVPMDMVHPDILAQIVAA